MIVRHPIGIRRCFRAIGWLGATMFCLTANAELAPSYQFNDRGNWSLDAVGGNGEPVGTLQAVVPVGSTVEQAFLYAATNFASESGPPSQFTPFVDFDGTVISGGAWTSLGTLGDLCCPEGLSLESYRADVTTQVAAQIGTGSATPFTFDVLSEIEPGGDVDDEQERIGVDGLHLAVVYSNPAEVERTIVFLDGFSTASGDTAVFEFAEPLDTENLEASLSLGISFSFEGSGGQVSTVDVNGRRLTTSAGGNDDGDGVDGGLITVGGIGDSPSNPDPFSGPDDELYDLAQGNVVNPAPFLNDGDTVFRVNTVNPSNNDNIYFLGLNVTAEGVVIPEPNSSLLSLFGLLGLISFRSSNSRR